MKICYLSSTQLGKEMYSFLKTQPGNITYCNTENERIRNFDELDYDLGISFLYTYKIPRSEFIKNKIWVNFHPGPLPEYRGRNLCYHAIMNGAAEFGATLHYMDAEFDTGKIIKVLQFPIEPAYTAGDLSELSKQALVDLFKEYIPKLLKKEEIAGIEQEKDNKYYKQSAIDEEIQLTAQQQQKVRALTVAPRFYAHTYINGRKYFLVPESDIKSKNC